MLLVLKLSAFGIFGGYVLYLEGILAYFLGNLRHRGRKKKNVLLHTPILQQIQAQGQSTVRRLK